MTEQMIIPERIAEMMNRAGFRLSEDESVRGVQTAYVEAMLRATPEEGDRLNAAYSDFVRRWNAAAKAAARPGVVSDALVSGATAGPATTGSAVHVVSLPARTSRFRVIRDEQGRITEAVKIEEDAQ